MWQLPFLHLYKNLLGKKGFDNIGDGGHLGEILRIVATEDKTIFYIPFYSANQGLRDAVGGSLWAAFFKAAITFMDGFLGSCDFV